MSGQNGHELMLRNGMLNKYPRTITRPMSRRPLAWGVAAAAALALVAMLATPSLAGSDSGTKRLYEGNFIAVEIPFTSDSALSLDISYEVTVTSGPAVDVYFMDEVGYWAFVEPGAGEFSYYAAHSYVGTTYATDSFAWYEKGTFYVVVQQTGGSQTSASDVEYAVEWEESAIGSSMCFALGAILAAIVIGAIVIAIIRAKRPAPKVDRWGRPLPPSKPPPPAIVRPAPAPAPQAQPLRTAPAIAWASGEQTYDVAPEQGAPAAPVEGPLPEPVYAAPAAYRMDRPRTP